MTFREENRIRTIRVTFSDEERNCLPLAYSILNNFEDLLLHLDAGKIKLNEGHYSIDDIATVRNLLYDLRTAANFNTFKIDIESDPYDDDDDDEEETEGEKNDY